MRIFIAKIASGRLPRAEHSRLVRILLDRAVELMWGNMDRRIAKTPEGKPIFVGDEGRFLSLSHTEGAVLAALSETPVGADIQSPREIGAAARSRIVRNAFEENLGALETFSLRESLYKLSPTCTAPLRPVSGEIFASGEGAYCRLYRFGECVAAAASFTPVFPDALELLEI